MLRRLGMPDLDPRALLAANHIDIVCLHARAIYRSPLATTSVQDSGGVRQKDETPDQTMFLSNHRPQRGP